MNRDIHPKALNFKGFKICSMFWDKPTTNPNITLNNSFIPFFCCFRFWFEKPCATPLLTYWLNNTALHNTAPIFWRIVQFYGFRWHFKSIPLRHREYWCDPRVKWNECNCPAILNIAEHSSWDRYGYQMHISNKYFSINVQVFLWEITTGACIPHTVYTAHSTWTDQT